MSPNETDPVFTAHVSSRLEQLHTSHVLINVLCYYFAASFSTRKKGGRLWHTVATFTE